MATIPARLFAGVLVVGFGLRGRRRGWVVERGREENEARFTHAQQAGCTELRARASIENLTPLARSR